MNRIFLIIALSILYIGLPLFLSAEEKEDVKVIEYIVARVNNKVITSSELERAVTRMEMSRDGKDMTKEEIKRTVLNRIINEKLVESIAEIMSIEAPDNEINRRIELIKKENRITTDDELDKSLKAQGMSLAWLRKEIEKAYIYQAIVGSKVYGRIKIKDDEIRDYYNRYIEEYSSGEEVRLRQIFISTSNTSKIEARKRIREAYQKLEDGMDFQEAVRLYSDESAKVNDGDLGSFKKGEIIRQIDEVAFKLDLGEYSDIVETDNGYHIIQVTEKKIAKQIPIENVKQEITDKLRREKYADASEKYMKELRDDYYVEILDPEFKSQEGREEKDNDS